MRHFHLVIILALAADVIFCSLLKIGSQIEYSFVFHQGLYYER